MTDFNAIQHYWDCDDLARLPLTDLQRLWESVPTEEQAYLVGVFEREADKRQILEDRDECQMIQHFLEQYQQVGLVPAGAVWVKIPAHIRDDYRLNTASETPLEDTESVSKTAPSALPRWLIFLALPVACLFVFALFRGLSAPSMSNLPSLSPSPSASPSLTPSPSPSPSPLALSGFDAAIREGERQRRDYYPVQLQIFPERTRPPRVFIVQEQVIDIAEWRFANNPDLVSWLSGMIIKPVLGLPFSPSNLDLLRSLGQESVFVVTMNTGAVLQFVYTATQQVQRSETHWFRQDRPGLVLVLMGETFANGEPTDLRYLIQAHYPPEQELGRLTTSTPLIPMDQSLHVNDTQIQVHAARLLASDTLPPELTYAVIDLQILTGANEFNLLPLLENDTGQRLSMDNSAVEIAACSLLTTPIPAQTSICQSARFIVPANTQTGRLWLGESAFELLFTRALPSPTVQDLTIQLGQMSYSAQELTVEARLHNPTTEAISISANDMSLVLGLIPNPIGLAISPLVATQQIAPQTSLELELRFPYHGEAYGSLTIGAYVWALELR